MTSHRLKTARNDDQYVSTNLYFDGVCAAINLN